MIDITRLKKSISRISDSKQLLDLERYCRERNKLLGQRAWVKQCADKWEELRTVTVGTVLYCNASGTFLGGPMQRGDSGKVYSIQQRKRMIWIEVTRSGEVIGFPPAQLARYQLQLTPPNSGISETERKMASAVGKVIKDEGLL